MEPTSEEYTSKMRVGLVRQNLVDGAAPLGLKPSHTSKVTLTPALSLHASLSPSSLSLPSLASTRRPVRTARRRPRARPRPRPHSRSGGQELARAGERPHGPDRTPGAHGAGSRGQGTGPDCTPGAQDQAAGPARRLLPRAPRKRASSAWEPASWPPAAPSQVNPLLFLVDPCWIVHPCSCVKDI